jgi:putative addiction module killer protein
MSGIAHTKTVKYEVLKTSEFVDWLDEQQPKMRTQILARIDLLSVGHFGNHKRFEGLLELRWLNGTRVYSFLWGQAIVVALYGGNKHAQDRDIKKAKRIRDEILEGTRSIHK